MNVIDQIEAQQIKKDLPDVRVGDTVRVHMEIVEGEKKRVQVFEGVVISLSGGGNRKTITVRKVSFNVGVERIFPLNSPNVKKIETVKSARVRRAKLYFLRNLRGKAARLKELKKHSTRKKKSGSKAKKPTTKKASA